MSRFTVILLVILLIPVILVGAVMVLLANPDYYRPRLTQTFESATGFQLNIGGELNWRYWPPIALHVTDIDIRPRGAEIPLATIRDAAIDLPVLPLLLGSDEMAIDGITVDGLTINALVDKAGKANWEPPAAPPKKAAPPAGTEAGGAEFGLDISEIELSDVVVTYKDDSAGADYLVTVPSFSTGPVRFDAPAATSFTMAVDDRGSGMHLDVKGDGDVSFDREFKRIAFNRLALLPQITLPDMKPIDAALTLDGNFDTAASRLVTDLDGKVDNSTVKGNASVQLGDKLAIAFDLAMDRVNLDDYLGGSAELTDATATAPVSTRPQDVEVLPLELLNAMDITGKLSLVFFNYDIWALHDLKLSVENGNKRIKSDLTGKGYGGDIHVTFTGSTASAGAGQTGISVSNIDVAELDLVRFVTGRATITSDTTFKGHMLSAILDSLDGTTTFNVAGGTMDITPVKRTVMLVDTLRGKDSGIADWPDKMPFEKLDGRQRLVNGIKANQQLDFTFETVHIAGTGGLDYFGNHLDYDLTVALENTEGAAFHVGPTLEGVQWPFRCEGDIDAALTDICGPDEKGVQRVVADIAKQQVKRKGEESIREKIEEKVPDKFKDALKDLFKRND